jgi:hypothetical protein
MNGWMPSKQPNDYKLGSMPLKGQTIKSSMASNPVLTAQCSNRRG